MKYSIKVDLYLQVTTNIFAKIAYDQKIINPFAKKTFGCSMRYTLTDMFIKLHVRDYGLRACITVRRIQASRRRPSSRVYIVVILLSVSFYSLLIE